MVFERLEKRTILEGKIEALTPLHVGSGRPEFEVTAVDLPVIKDVFGNPYVPGSSLKGKVRSEAERIARRLDYDVCNAPNVKQMCGWLKESEEQLCTVCKVFGTAGERISRASKVKFRDSYPLKRPEKSEIRTGVAIDRETGAVVTGALYTIEGVPAGTAFSLEIVCDNIDDKELALLLAAVKSVEDTSIGGSSTRGFGKVRFSIDRVRLRTAEYYVGKAAEEMMEGEALVEWLDEKRKMV